MDYIIDIHAATAILDSSLAEVLQRKFDFSKPVRWLGQRDPGASWEEISTEAAGTARLTSICAAACNLPTAAGP